MDKIEEVKKIASMVWAFGLNQQMGAEGKPVRFSPEEFWGQKLINKNPYFDFAQQICQLFKLPEGEPPLLGDEEIGTLKYIVSVLETQYVTTFEDENADGEMEEYAALDIPIDEYEGIRNRIYTMIKEHSPKR